MPERWPQTNTRIEINNIEAIPPTFTGKTHKETQDDRNAEPEEEEEDDDEDEDEDEDEEGDEEGEEGDGDEEEEEEDDDEGEEEEGGVPDDYVAHAPLEDRYFMHNESLRSKFNEVELDSFMKLLNVKPKEQW